ncbi:MAG: DKNYY domain-containing protein [bacterium]|nr:DKNYY domain-containing protein [bacterium]
MVKNFSHKLTVVAVLGAGIIVGGIFVYSKSVEKSNTITFVAGTNDKIRYIKAKDCPEVAYESKDTNDYFYSMCKAYTTDGLSVYYDGMREMVLPTMISPVMINGRFSSSSLPTYRQSEPEPVLLEGVDLSTFEIISTDYLEDSLDPKQNPTLTYARDRNSLYRFGEKVVDADPNTLIILGNGYMKDKNSVYFQGKKMEGSNAKTFKFLKYGYAHDKNFVYLMQQQGKKIENSNGETFKILDENYAKDSNAVYYQQKKLEGADPSTFEIVYQTYPEGGAPAYPSGYTKDKSSLFYQGVRVEGADPITFKLIGYGVFAHDKNFVYGSIAKKLLWIDASTFEIVSDGYFKDKNAVYYGEGAVVNNADPATFKYLSGGYLKDKNSVWKSVYSDEGGAVGSMPLIKNADSETFQFVKYSYARDKNFAYYYGEVIPGAIPSSFVALEQVYSKDSNSAFYLKDKINNVDAASFEVVDSMYSKDKNSVYHRGVKLEGVNPSSLAIFTCGYAKDASKVFRVMYDGKMTLMDVSDPSSFTMFENGCYAKDKNFVYYFNYDGSKIEGANPKTFEVIDGWYTKDSTSVYYSGLKIEGAVPSLFKVMNIEYAKDKNFVYYKGSKIDGADVVSFEIGTYGTEVRDKNTKYLSGRAVKAGELIRPDGTIVPGPSVYGLPTGIPIQIYPMGL